MSCNFTMRALRSSTIEIRRRALGEESHLKHLRGNAVCAYKLGSAFRFGGAVTCPSSHLSCAACKAKAPGTICS